MPSFLGFMAPRRIHLDVEAFREPSPNFVETWVDLVRSHWRGSSGASPYHY